MSEPDRIITKLLRPPSVANWVRYNYRRTDDTEAGINNFLRAVIRHSLVPVYKILAQMATAGISEEQALKSLSFAPQERVRTIGVEIIQAFAHYCRQREFEGIETFPGLNEKFQIGRSKHVPVRPTFVIYEDGKPVPIFIIAWAKEALNEYQKRLLATVIYEAILTLQDFIGSDAEVIFIHRMKGTKARIVKIMRVSTVSRLSADELNEQIERYGIALDRVIEAILAGG